MTRIAAPEVLGTPGLLGALAAVGELQEEFPLLLAAWLRHGEQVLPDPAIALDGIRQKTVTDGVRSRLRA